MMVAPFSAAFDVYRFALIAIALHRFLPVSITYRLNNAITKVIVKKFIVSTKKSSSTS